MAWQQVLQRWQMVLQGCLMQQPGPQRRVQQQGLSFEEYWTQVAVLIWQSVHPAEALPPVHFLYPAVFAHVSGMQWLPQRLHAWCPAMCWLAAQLCCCCWRCHLQLPKVCLKRAWAQVEAPCPGSAPPQHRRVAHRRWLVLVQLSRASLAWLRP